MYGGFSTVSQETRPGRRWSTLCQTERVLVELSCHVPSKMSMKVMFTSGSTRARGFLLSWDQATETQVESYEF